MPYLAFARGIGQRRGLTVSSRVPVAEILDCMNLPEPAALYIYLSAVGSERLSPSVKGLRRAKPRQGSHVPETLFGSIGKLGDEPV